MFSLILLIFYRCRCFYNPFCKCTQPTLFNFFLRIRYFLRATVETNPSQWIGPQIIIIIIIIIILIEIYSWQKIINISSNLKNDLFITKDTFFFKENLYLGMEGLYYFFEAGRVINNLYKASHQNFLLIAILGRI
jgi:hypothetical protein